MDKGDSIDRPFDAIAETVNEQTAEAFELLGNETRLEIIVTLWDAIDPTTDIAEKDESGLSFSALYDRVGVDDSGQFNYHLDKLTGTFVDHDDDTYTLTQSAHDILSAVIAGAVHNTPSFTDEPVDGHCPLCGESVVIDYENRTLSIRCTTCEGNFRSPDDPPGLLMTSGGNPAGLTNRTPQEFFHQVNVSFRHNVLSFVEGVCANCTGTVTATSKICEEHESGDGSLCPECGRRNQIWWNFVCDVCKNRIMSPGDTPITAETAVVSFCYERGLDLGSPNGVFEWKKFHDATYVSVSSRDPLEVRVTVELESDRLTVTVDGDAQVVDIEETIGFA